MKENLIESAKKMPYDMLYIMGLIIIVGVAQFCFEEYILPAIAGIVAAMLLSICIYVKKKK